MALVAAIIATLFMYLPLVTQVSGRVLDRTGKPLAGVQVIYSSVRTGKTYKFKTDDKGEFTGAGVMFAVYRVKITGVDGQPLYRTKKRIWNPATPGFTPQTNYLNADLSMISLTDLPGGIKANVNPGDLTERQKQIVREHNANIGEMNELIRRLHVAIEAQKWPAATDILIQLIAADPERWEFYQNLGTVQSNQSQYEDASRSYERAIELAKSGATTGTQPDEKDISLMMLYAGDAYARIGNLEKAIDFYSKAAEISPDPATAFFNICRAQRGNGSTAAATVACDKAIALDPSRAEFYQVLGTMEENAGQDQPALATFENGIQAAEKEIAAQPSSTQAKAVEGQMLDAEGNIYVHRKKFDEAIAAFSRAVDMAAYPAREYFNICAAYYDTDRMDAAVEACDKAMAADPRMADAYFVKASALLGKSGLEHGRLTAPPAAREALEKYLELDPEGVHAPDVREMLAKIAGHVDTILKQHN
jgi:tetratricopeptide (TPR) repeat protein